MTRLPRPFPPSLLLGLLALVLVALPRAAAATTVAVLPLAKGAGSETYDGLGSALSGMLVSDLSQADSLTLVERERLDDLLAEIELGDGGFVDPATAQRLGRGLGAEVVLTGSYSVVAETFLLDARLVRVESGEVVQAADSQGLVAEFVAVEKALVEQLLEGLEVALSMGARRKILMQAPTERFGAFAAWGEGLHHRDQGDLDAARVAFERAVAEDPEFEEARAALAVLREQVESARQAQRLVADAFLDERFRAVLAETVDERTRPDGFAHDPDTLAALMVRQAVLHDAGLHCQRAEELQAFLDHVDWAVEIPRSSPAVAYRAGQLAEAFGLTRDEARRARVRLGLGGLDLGSELFQSTTSLVLEMRAATFYRRGDGLVDSLLSCAGEQGAADALDGLSARIRAAGQADRIDDERRPLPLGAHAELLWAWQQARAHGADDRLSDRTAAVLDAVGTEQARDIVLSRMDDILREADHHARYRAGSLGLSPARVEALMVGVAEGDPAVVTDRDGACGWILDNQRSAAKSWVVRLRELQAEEDPDRRFSGLRLHLGGAANPLGPLGDLGCLQGIPPRFGNLAGIMAGAEQVALLPDAATSSTCVGLHQSMQSMVDNTRGMLDGGYALPPQSEWAMAWGLLATWYGLVQQRCVALPVRR